MEKESNKEIYSTFRFKIQDFINKAQVHGHKYSPPSIFYYINFI